jgi:hypothetical protein
MFKNPENLSFPCSLEVNERFLPFKQQFPNKFQNKQLSECIVPWPNWLGWLQKLFKISFL